MSARSGDLAGHARGASAADGVRLVTKPLDHPAGDKAVGGIVLGQQDT